MSGSHLFRKFVVPALVFTILGSLSLACAAAETARPFKSGERMHFVLRWGVVSAGEATLEVHEMEQYEGTEAYHFVMTARSNSFIDVFFKVRDRIDSYADAGMKHSLYYKKDQLEGKTRRDIKVDFDWDKNESTYVNLNTEPKIINQVPGSFDPLAVFYYIRTLDLQEGMEIEQPVTDGKKNMMGILRVTGREQITVAAGTFDTLLLEPDLKNVEGVFSKKQRAKIKLWVTDDEHRMLVKMKSKAKLGSFVAELQDYQGFDDLTITGSLRDNSS
jgi:hypothetical protein